MYIPFLNDELSMAAMMLLINSLSDTFVCADIILSMSHPWIICCARQQLRYINCLVSFFWGRNSPSDISRSIGAQSSQTASPHNSCSLQNCGWDWIDWQWWSHSDLLSLLRRFPFDYYIRSIWASCNVDALFEWRAVIGGKTVFDKLVVWHFCACRNHFVNEPPLDNLLCEAAMTIHQFSGKFLLRAQSPCVHQ